MRPRGLLAVLTGLMLLLSGCGLSGTGESGLPQAPPGSAASPSWADGMSVVTSDRLPPEAADTLALIEDDGPFPHDKDGTVFHNYEGLLPGRSDGYYREYTVDTPGVRGRGARRIVTGDGGEVFYTDDHYETFQAVARR